MTDLHPIFAKSEPLLLFVIIGVGFMIGQIKVKGFSLGIAGVLFIGLLFGSWQNPLAPEGQKTLVIAKEITEIGLILFVYAVGLTSGPGFFASLKKRGIRFNLIIAFTLTVSAGLTLFLGRLLGLSPGVIGGVYCGALTNTPALAAVTQWMKNSNDASVLSTISDPTVGYAVAYPYAVLGGLMAIQLFIWFFQKEFDAEKDNAQRALQEGGRLINKNFVIQNPAIIGQAIGILRIQEKTGLIVSRIRHSDVVSIPTKYTVLNQGDVIVAVGKQSDMDNALQYFGAESTEQLELSRERIEMRRILMSRRDLIGKSIDELELDHRFNAQVTRIRRADVDIVASPDITLELGDRLRVVMPREHAAEVTKFFGDSERDIAELDYAAITLGISLGVLIGMIPFPFPGLGNITLGFAGGPLLVGLILGRQGKTGPLVWNIPLEANHALRHIGLLFFLAGIGVTAGGRFLDSLATDGWKFFVLGAFTTTFATAASLFLLKIYGKASVISALGATCGMQTQPATLARCYEISKSDETYVAYSTTYPIAMIGKIILAQVMVVIGFLLSR